VAGLLEGVTVAPTHHTFASPVQSPRTLHLHHITPDTTEWGTGGGSRCGWRPLTRLLPTGAHMEETRVVVTLGVLQPYLNDPIATNMDQMALAIGSYDLNHTGMHFEEKEGRVLTTPTEEGEGQTGLSTGLEHFEGAYACLSHSYYLD